MEGSIPLKIYVYPENPQQVVLQEEFSRTLTVAPRMQHREVWYMMNEGQVDLSNCHKNPELQRHSD